MDSNSFCWTAFEKCNFACHEGIFYATTLRKQMLIATVSNKDSPVKINGIHSSFQTLREKRVLSQGLVICPRRRCHPCHLTTNVAQCNPRNVVIQSHALMFGSKGSNNGLFSNKEFCHRRYLKNQNSSFQEVILLLQLQHPSIIHKQ